MTKEMANELAKKTFAKYAFLSQTILDKSEKQGRLRAGLDSNKELTKALDEEMKLELQKIHDMIVE